MFGIILSIVVVFVVVLVVLGSLEMFPFALIRNNPTDMAWDRKLNELMKQYKFTERTECRAKLGPYEIWVANHPYSSFHSHQNGNIPNDVLPSRFTAMKAWKKLNVDCPLSTVDDKIKEFENTTYAKVKSKRSK